MMENSISKSVNVLSIHYIKLLRLFLWPLDIWPGEVFGEKNPVMLRIHRKSVAVQIFIIILGQINYLIQKKGEHNIFDVGHVFLTIVLMILTTTRTILPSFQKYGVITKRFVAKFHLAHFKHSEKYFEQVNIFTNKVSSFCIHFWMAMTVLGIIGFNIIPMFKNYKRGVFSSKGQNNVTYEFVVYYKFPGFELLDYFTLCTIYNFYLSCICASYISSTDLFIVLLSIQVIGHLYTLKASLKNVTHGEKFVSDKDNNLQLKEKMFNSEENNKIHLKLKEIIDHHRFIIGFTKDLSSFFGPILGINYLCHLVVCCLTLLECSQGDPNIIIRYGPLTLLVFGQLISISVVFEVVKTMSEKLKYELYYLSWERMNIRNRRTFYIFLHKLQTPINVKAMGITTVGVETMAKILKTALSYFTFLKSINDEENSV